MANRERGEVALVIPGERGAPNREYTLRLSMNAAVALETRLKKRLGIVIAEAELLSFEAIRHIVWVLLQKYHAAEFKDEEAVGNLIDDAGGVSVFFELMRQVSAANQQETQDGGGGAAEGNPPDAPGGTGASSTSKLGAGLH